METLQEQDRDARINALFEDLSSTNDSAEAARKARELRLLVAGQNPETSSEAMEEAEVRRAFVNNLFGEWRRRQPYNLGLNILVTVTAIASGWFLASRDAKLGFWTCLLIAFLISLPLLVASSIHDIRQNRRMLSALDEAEKLPLTPEQADVLRRARKIFGGKTATGTKTKP